MHATWQIKIKLLKKDTENTLVFVSILKYYSNMIPAVRKIVPEFITSLDCKGLVDGTVTHIIVSTK